MLGSLWRGRRRLFRVEVTVDRSHLYVIPMNSLKEVFLAALEWFIFPYFSHLLCRSRLLRAFSGRGLSNY